MTHVLLMAALEFGHEMTLVILMVCNDSSLHERRHELLAAWDPGAEYSGTGAAQSVGVIQRRSRFISQGGALIG